MNDETITLAIKHAIDIIRRGRAMEKMLLEAGFTIPEIDIDSDHQKIAASGPVKAKPKAPEWPKTNDNGELVDVRGLVWDERIHTSNKSCNENGTWRKRRGVDQNLIMRLEREALEQIATRGASQSDPRPTEDWLANDHEPAEPTPTTTFESIVDGIRNAAGEDEVAAWLEESRHIVISASQRMVLEQARNERLKDLSAGQAV